MLSSLIYEISLLYDLAQVLSLFILWVIDFVSWIIINYDVSKARFIVGIGIKVLILGFPIKLS